MKQLMLVVLFLSVPLFVFAQDIPAFPDIQVASSVPDFTWTKELSLQPGESVDLVSVSEQGFKNAWCKITGRAMINDMETDFASWCDNSKVKLTAIGSISVIIYGK